MAILEFGTSGRIDSGGGKGNCREERSRSIAAVEGDGRLTILSSIPVARQLLVAPVLDAEHGSEWHIEPPVGDGPCHAEVVRRIGEGDVVCAGLEVADESERVLAMQTNGVAGAEEIDVVLDRA